MPPSKRAVSALQRSGGYCYPWKQLFRFEVVMSLHTEFVYF